MRIGERLLLIGPNRRSDRTLYELQLIPDPGEAETLASRAAERIRAIRAAVPGLDEAASPWLDAVLAEDEPLARVARLYNALALALQRRAGHRVAESGFEPDGAGAGVWTWWEYENDRVAVEAAELALRLLSTSTDEAPGRISMELEAFLDTARQGVMPGDTEALVRAAERLDLPCAKLERDPYPGLEGDFRVRRHGLLMIGHGRHRQIVDGTFCVSRCARLQPLIRDREALRVLLASWNVPLPSRAPGADNCALTRRALRAAETIGYPVVVKPGRRGSGGVTQDVRTPDSLRAAVDSARTRSAVVTVEAMIPGQSYRLLLAGGEPLVVLCRGEEMPVDAVHPTTLDLAREIADRLDVGMLNLDVVTADITRPLAETGGAVVDADLAPELDRLLPPESPLLDAAAEQFLRWLFPPDAPSRITILAVTGTNGKTTTCRMAARILRAAGRQTGLVCSEGVYANGTREASRRDRGPGVHHFMLDREDLEAVVFEEYFGLIARVGFSYRWSDVAVCTNVTEDHLGRIGTHTLEQMAELKFAVPVRARGAVVLNADNAFCLAMAERCSAKRICLVSTRRLLEAEVRPFGERGARCVVERRDGGEWVVLYDGPRCVPLLPVADIPATFEGTAAFNVSNALHAAAACYFAGVAPDGIVAGLASFEMSYEATPGRLNRFQRLPYTVVMDYAHNADGFRQIAAWANAQPTAGRRILMAGFTGDRRDAEIVAAAGELAGHFDEYICRNFRNLRMREPHEVPALLRQGLLDSGVDPGSVHVEPDAGAAVDHALGMSRPGDLVVLLVGSSEFDDVWQRLHAMADATEAASERAT